MVATTPTLTGMSSLGKMQLETYTKSTNVISLPFPLETNDETTENYGLSGASGIITIQGLFTGEIGDLNLPIIELRTIANADPVVTSQATYVSNMFPSGIKVVVMSVRSTLTVGVQSKLDYEIKLIVGVGI